MTNMNAGMRTVLAAAAAGALVLGSAGGAAAHPHKSDRAQGPEASKSEPMSKLQTVRIKGHKKIDLAKVSETTALKLRAKVRYSEKVEAGDALASVGLKLAVYDRKFSKDMVPGSETADPVALSLKVRKGAKKNQFYAGPAVILQEWSEAQVGVLAGEVAKDGKAFICLSDVDEPFNKYSKQTRKRLDMDVKRPVRDCVKVVNSDDV